MATTDKSWIQYPGFYIREEMEARGWLQRDLAFILGIPEQSVNMIVSGKRGISPDMARALGEAFDVSAEFFANLQQAYDLAQAKQPDPSVAARREMQSIYPVREMIKRGWIEDMDAKLLEEQLVRFFGVKNPSYIPYLPHAAKKSKYEDRRITPEQLAWLFRVKQIAKSISAVPYKKKKLEDTIEKCESLLHAPEEARHVPRLLMESGVRLIFVEKLPKASIDGVCFWLDKSSPVIGMSLRFDRIDNFWFVIRHEIEHVLRGHGKDDEIIDDLQPESTPTDELREEERLANGAASDFCAPTESLDSFMARKHPYYYERDVISFASRHGRHPGLVVGQMHFRLKRYDYLIRHLQKIRKHVLPGSISDGWGRSLSILL